MKELEEMGEFELQELRDRIDERLLRIKQKQRVSNLEHALEIAKKDLDVDYDKNYTQQEEFDYLHR